MRIDQIEELDSIESITDGASSRRNQLLVDLGSELNLGAIDGAAEADLAGLRAQVTKLARTYKPYGPVLSDAINDQLRTVLGPSGKRPGAIAERVKKTWELGDGWAKHVTVEVALGTREGTSVRGGAMGHLHEGALADAASVDKVIDAAVASVAARHGISVALPSAGGGGGATVDAAALSEFTDQITGRDGVLASAARLVLGQLGLDDPVSAAPAATDAELIDLVTAELGADWPRLVAPAFDAKKAVVFDDRWASAREDLVKLWLTDEGDIDADWVRLSERFEGAGHVVATQATWWQGKSLAAGRQIHASLYGRIAAGAENPDPGPYSNEIAVVTGASKGSIAASVVARLLDGGATVIATTSKLDDERLAFYRALYRDHARYGAALWVVAANMASYSDIDALVEWIGNEQTESLGPQSIHIKDAQTPTLLFPFAAPRVAGDLSEAGSRSEMEMKVLLWAVQRLIGGLSKIGAERDIASRLHVVLPGSPNRGMFGGDGAYGEAKSALDAVVSRWHAESSWAARVSLAHALIGWTRGTGLMGHNDAIVERGRGGRCHHLLHRRDGGNAAGPVRCGVQGGRGQRADQGRPDRRAGRGQPRHGRTGRQGARARRRARQATGRRRGRGHHRRAAVAAARLHPGAAAAMGRPRRRPGRPGGHRRRRRDRPVRFVAHPLRDGGRQRTVGGRCPRTGLDHRTDPLGGRPATGLVRHRIRRSGRRSRAGRALPRHRGGARAAFASSSTTARSTPITRRRCWCRCSWTRTSPSWCRRRPTPARSSSSIRSTRSSGRCPTRATGRSPQGRHRDPGAAQDQAVADRRRPDPDRVRPDRVGHQPGHGQLHRPAGGVEHRRDRRRVPVRRLQPGRGDALGAPEPGGQHPGHRHGRHDVDADDVPRQPAGPEQAERHPAGGPAEYRCRACGSVLHRQLRLDDPPGRRVRDRGGVGRGGRRQDPARQGRAGGRRRLRRPDAGGHHRLR